MPSDTALSLTPADARRFHLRATRLAGEKTTLGEVFAHLGYVQVDPLNVCGRMHELILRNRVAGYTNGELHRWVHGATPGQPRGGFEHYLPRTGILAALPFSAWRQVSSLMRERSRRPSGYLCALEPGQKSLAERVLRELRDRGPLSSDDIEHEGSAKTAWGTRGTAVKAVLEKLFAHGRVLISKRRGFRRIYDLPERILPAELLGMKPASEAEVARWSILLRLQQRRLVPLSRKDLSLVREEVAALDVPGCPRLYCLRGDVGLLDRKDEEEDGCRLLAPLDPVIVDRRLTHLLWNFDYTWEVYTPAAKRVRGYYALPVLQGLEFAGHVEPRLEDGRLRVLSRKVKRGCALSEPLRELERFLRAQP